MSRSIRIRNIIKQLEEKGFDKTIDSISEYSPNANLYYKQIDENRFLVFNHYNKSKKVNLQGFDCWISRYNSKEEIGKKKAIDTEDVRLTFDFEKDWKLLENYL